MGKVKRNKNAQRQNPMNEITPESEEVVFVQERDENTFIENVIAKLKSVKDQERENGCDNLCIAADHHVSSIIETGLLRILGPLLADPNHNVRRAAVGALKNLSLSSEDPTEIVQELMRADVLTPLLALFDKLSEEMDDEETFIQAINLLWNLCESSSTALDRAFENFKLLELFLNYLDKSPRVRIPILQCILTVSEDNPKVVTYLEEKKEHIRELIVKESSPLEERILACGIILNIMSSECDENELKIILGIISLVLDQDHRLLISEFSKRLSLKNEELEGKSSFTDKSSMDTEDNSELELISLLNAQQRALEILTNLFCDSGEYEEASEEGEDEDEQDMTSNDSQMDDKEGLSSSIPPFIVEAIQSHNLVHKLLQKAILPPMEIVHQLRESIQGKDLLRSIRSLRSKSFLCFNNILISSSIQLKELIEGGSSDDRLFEIWTELGTLCFGESQENDISVLESAISALRALTQRLCEIRCKNFSSITFQELNMMLELTKISGSEVRINVVHIVGNLGALNLGDDVTKGLANFLLETAHRDSDVGVCAEALDKILDLFAEDETDQLAVEVSLIPRLKGLSNGFKVKSGRMPKEDQKYPLVHTAKLNLSRFIKYKSKRPLVFKSLSS
ncbi:HEAT repeat-containing protein 3 [Lepeophtheirus salmonis]|uniref:HEAT repeat-containing protein 3 n=1 Tax=Lepeophtheirus salmonis TaxID=72036 RepID=UPI001AE15371|nr:HEAT repeat-containing protein 3-like [Lepeophtheirus salmonis]